MSRKLCYLLACFHLPTIASPISFSQAWQLLLRDNHTLAAERANVKRFEHVRQSAEGLSHPRVTLNANYTVLDDDITLSGEQLMDSLDSQIQLPPNIASILDPILQKAGGIKSTLSDRSFFSSSINMVWPIFTGWKISSAQTAAASGVEIAQQQLEIKKQKQFQNLSQYYFTVVLAKDVLQTRIAAEQGLRQHQKSALKMEKQGQIARVERLQADASLDKAVVERKKAEKDLEIAQSALTHLLNQTDPVSLRDRLFINQELPPLSQLIEKTLRTYPGLALFDAKDKQADSMIRSEKSHFYPNVFLFGNYTLYEEESLTSAMKPEWFAGIGVKLPILTGSGRSDKLDSAYSAKEQVKNLRAQAFQDLTVLVQKTYLEAQQAQQEVTGLASSVSLAEENLQLRQKGFSQGLSTSLDVVDAELYLANIHTQQSVAKFHYIMALTKLLALSSQMTQFSKYQETPLLTM